MNVILRGKGVDLNERLRQHATEKLSKVQKFFEDIIKLEVELSEEKNPRVSDRHKVEVTAGVPGETLHAHGAATDYFSAIDQAADRLEAQVKRYKDRLRDHSIRVNHDILDDIAVVEDEPIDEDGSPLVVRIEPESGKPIMPEEAILELQERKLQFLMFTNAEDMRAGVIYRRTDGSYGLIQQPH